MDECVAYTIHGIKLKFPCKAYPTQLSMMDKIMKGLDRQENCLLESPTGSGKSLALLCSCLAWQAAEYLKLQSSDENKIAAEKEDIKKNPGCDDCCGSSIKETGPTESTSVVVDLTTSETQMPELPQPAEQDVTELQTQDKHKYVNETAHKAEKDEEEEEDFQPACKRFRTPVNNQLRSKKRWGLQEDCNDEPEDKECGPPEWNMELVKEENPSADSERSAQEEPNSGCSKTADTKGGKEYPKVPKIFFGTRTHKQVAQITRELGKTAYHHARMCILSSREHSCIHPRVSKGKNKNEECKKLRDGSEGEMCSYHQRVHLLKSQSAIKKYGLVTAWDIEDLLRVGKKLKACPYYAARDLMKEADIVFCPYNYLIDPKIRKQMDINLKDQIVVLDEAHNIEDSARESASLTLNAIELQQALDDLDKLISLNAMPEQHTPLHLMAAQTLTDMVLGPHKSLSGDSVTGVSGNIDSLGKQNSLLPSGPVITCQTLKHSKTATPTEALVYGMVSQKILLKLCANLMRWIHQNHGGMKERGFEQAVKIFSGIEIIPALNSIGITAGTISICENLFLEIMAANKDPSKSSDMYSMTSHTISILEGLFLIFRYLFGFDRKFVADYRVAILKTAVIVRDNVLPGGWRKSGGASRKEWTFTLNFWCLNPSVVFTEIGAETRSIILTSGTLSPLNSFSSELGVTFPIKLEANHVVPNSQVWVGTLSVGPGGNPVNASYRFAETFTFQDEIGNVILHVCENVPHGVLCFVPSYSMLDKLSKRWQSTGLWAKLLQKKVVVSEPRSGGKSEFDDIMHQFYHAIRVSEGDEDDDEEDSDDEACLANVDGALFLAVCRGKVSEGLDFADNNARAVITVGIPFPNIKDIQVDLKRQYNNQYSSRRGLLTGGEWYEIQAFRALNQALGRCIRHKKDWGAILLVDERFSKSPRYSNSISKWVRQRIQHFTKFSTALTSLKDFTGARQLDPCPRTPASIAGSQFKTPTSARGSHLTNISPDSSAPQTPTSAVTPMVASNSIGFKPIKEENASLGPVLQQENASLGSHSKDPVLRHVATPQCNTPSGGTSVSGTMKEPVSFHESEAHANHSNVRIQQQRRSGSQRGTDWPGVQTEAITNHGSTVNVFAVSSPQQRIAVEPSFNQPANIRQQRCVVPQHVVCTAMNKGNTPVKYILPASPSINTPRSNTPVVKHYIVLNPQVSSSAQQMQWVSPVSGNQPVVLTPIPKLQQGAATPGLPLFTSPLDALVNLVQQSVKAGQISAVGVASSASQGSNTIDSKVVFPNSPGKIGQASSDQICQMRSSGSVVPVSRHSLAIQTNTTLLAVQNSGLWGNSDKGILAPNVSNKLESNNETSSLGDRESVDREMSTQGSSLVDRDACTQNSSQHCTEVERSTQDIAFSVSEACHHPTDRILCDEDSDVRDEESEMRDFECSNSPALFSTPEGENAQMSDVDQEDSNVLNVLLEGSNFSKVGNDENSFSQAEQGVDNKGQNSDSKRFTRNSVYGTRKGNSTHPTDKIHNTRHGITTRSLFRKTSVATATSTVNDDIPVDVGENKESVLRDCVKSEDYRVKGTEEDREPTNDKESIIRKSVLPDHPTNDMAGIRCDVKEKGHEQVCDHKMLEDDVVLRDDDGHKEKTTTRSNLRRASRSARMTRGTRRLSMEGETNAEEFVVDRTMKKETCLYCNQCDAQLLKGVADLQTINRKEVTDLFSNFTSTTETRLNNKRKRNAVDGKLMFVASKRDISVTCPLLPSHDVAGNRQCYGLNALYIPEEGRMYVPQLCNGCLSKQGNSQSPLVGVEVISIETAMTAVITTQSREIWLFSEAVTKKP